MNTSLCDLLENLIEEPPVSSRRLRLTPLRLQQASKLQYLTLDQDQQQLITVEETTPMESVPELRVHNLSGQRVLIPEGTTLVGAKQNRVVNLSLMLAPESVTIIPVSCVERGRWQFLTGNLSPSWCADVALRRMMCAGAMASVKTTGHGQAGHTVCESYPKILSRGRGLRYPRGDRRSINTVKPSLTRVVDKQNSLACVGLDAHDVGEFTATVATLSIPFRLAEIRRTVHAATVLLGSPIESSGRRRGRPRARGPELRLEANWRFSAARRKAISGLALDNHA